MATLTKLIHADLSQVMRATADATACLVKTLDGHLAAGRYAHVVAVCSSVMDATADLAAGRLFLDRLAVHGRNLSESDSMVAFALTLADLVHALTDQAAGVMGDSPSVQTTMFRMANADALSRLVQSMQGIVKSTMAKVASGIDMMDAFLAARHEAMADITAPDTGRPLTAAQHDALEAGHDVKLEDGSSFSVANMTESQLRAAIDDAGTK